MVKIWVGKYMSTLFIRYPWGCGGGFKLMNGVALAPLYVRDFFIEGAPFGVLQLNNNIEVRYIVYVPYFQTATI